MKFFQCRSKGEMQCLVFLIIFILNFWNDIYFDSNRMCDIIDH